MSDTQITPAEHTDVAPLSPADVQTEAARRHFQELAGAHRVYNAALGLVTLLTLGAAILSMLAHRKDGFYYMLAWLVLMPLVAYWYKGFSRRILDRIAEQMNSVCLLDCVIDTLSGEQNGLVCNANRLDVALKIALPQVTPEQAHLITAPRRQFLLNRLYSARYGDEEYVLAVLRSVSVWGDAEALVLVRSIGDKSTDDAVRYAAQKCLPALEARVERLRQNETRELLQASAAPAAVSGDVLLRAASADAGTPAEQLLRAAQGD